MLKVGSPQIYVAHPMGKSDVLEENCARAIVFADKVYDLGAVPFIPALTVAWHRLAPKHYEEWMALDFAIIARCDALVRVPGESPGADREVAFAKQHGVPVLMSLAEVRDFVSAWTGRLGSVASLAAE